MSFFMNMGGRLLALAGLMCLLVGCGGVSGKPMSKVTGSVTYDGTPVEDGTISFNPASNAGTPASATVVNGTYVAVVAIGKYQVMVARNVKWAGGAGQMSMEEYQKTQAAQQKEYTAAVKSGRTSST